MNQTIINATTQGVHHVGLTVPNVEDTTNFFVNVLGYQLLGKRAEYPAAFVSDGTTMITLWQAADPRNATQFDRKNVIGLHHLAIKVANAASLDEIYERLQSADIAIEFSPEAQGTGSNMHLMCAIPGGIRLEIIAPA